MKKILIIDDDKTFLKVVRDALTQDGYEVTQAEDGEAGLEVARKEAPDLILLDIMMPQLGGMDFLKIVKEEEALKNIPILIVSNLSSMNRVNEGIKLGAHGYITKSDESLKTIVKSIESIVGKESISN